MKLTLNNLKTSLKKSSRWLPFITLGIIAAILVFVVARPRSVQIIQTIPADRTPNIQIDSTVSVKLNQSLPSSDQLQFTFQPPIPGNVTYSSDRTQATFQPIFNLQSGTQYTVSVFANNVQRYEFTFSTFSPGGNRFIGLPTPTYGSSASSDSIIAFTDTLPHREEKFTITHLKTSNYLIITINREPYEENKQAALNYIKSFGIPNPELNFNLSIDLAHELLPRVPRQAIEADPPPATQSATPNP